MYIYRLCARHASSAPCDFAISSVWVAMPYVYRICAVLLIMSHCATGVSRNCIEKSPWKFEVVAGITKIPFADGPAIPYITKAVCITGSPGIEVVLNNITINLLNTTVSDEQCRVMYKQLLCTDLRTPLPRRCLHAHQIVFAMLHSLEACGSKIDCRSRYTVPPMLCSWKRRLQNEVCSDGAHRIPDCANENEEHFSVSDFCFLNTVFCEFVVNNVVFMSMGAGILWAFATILVIYYGQNLCNRVESMEDRASRIMVYAQNNYTPILFAPKYSDNYMYHVAPCDVCAPQSCR